MEGNGRLVRGLGLVLALCGLLAVSLGCRSDIPESLAPSSGQTIELPLEDGSWTPQTKLSGRVPSGRGSIEIVDVGTFEFEVSSIETMRSDIFQEGHFSVFDILVALDDRGDIDLEYHYDPHMATHIIESLNGTPHWWYTAHYSEGWFETNVFRMDLYPYKDNTTIRVYSTTEEYSASICQTFGDEVRRLCRNDDIVVIPEVTIEDPVFIRHYEDVVVTAHDVRADALQHGVVTALDVLLSLGEQGELDSMKLTWYSSIRKADPVDHYFVDRIDAAESRGRCGYVYEVGPRRFSGFAGSHIHIPTDMRVLVSPEYALWFWICI